MDLQLFVKSATLTRTLDQNHENRLSFVMKLSGLCLLAVVAAVIALSEAEECPANIGEGEKVTVAHESDCHKYYSCTKGGAKELKTCPTMKDTTWCFDKVRKLCDLPEKVPCCNGSDDVVPDGCPCSTAAKCKMHYNDDIIEVCVKKTPITIPSIFS